MTVRIISSEKNAKVLLTNYLQGKQNFDISQHKTKVATLIDRLMVTSWNNLTGHQLHELSTYLKESLLPRLQKGSTKTLLVERIENLNSIFFLI